MRSSFLVLALDIGSSSVRSAFFTANGARCLPSTAGRDYAIRYSADGGAELDAATVLRATRSCVRETLRWRTRSSAHRTTPIAAVTGCAFWHNLLALDHLHRPISPIFMWADSRSVADAAALRRRFSERKIHARTGCMLRTSFWPAKLRWLRRTQPSLFRRAAYWSSPADWIFRELFGGEATSPSMASGTGLYRLKSRGWDEELCASFHVRSAQLDPLAAATEATTSCFPELHGLPVFRAIGDGAASNLGSGADRAGRVAITIGTSGAVRQVMTGREAPAVVSFGLFKYAVDEDRVVIGGAVSNGGNLREWFLSRLQLSPKVVFSRRDAATDRLRILPFWVGERAPTWPEDLRGVITGLTAATTAVDLLRASTTAVFYRLADILDALPLGATPEVIVSGGVLHSPNSLAILADALGCDIRVCAELESSLRGGAIHALEKLGFSPRPLRPGKIIRHDPAFAALHCERRRQQNELEQRLR